MRGMSKAPGTAAAAIGRLSLTEEEPVLASASPAGADAAKADAGRFIAAASELASCERALAQRTGERRVAVALSMMV